MASCVSGALLILLGLVLLWLAHQGRYSHALFVASVVIISCGALAVVAGFVLYVVVYKIVKAQAKVHVGASERAPGVPATPKEAGVTTVTMQMPRGVHSSEKNSELAIKLSEENLHVNAPAKLRKVREIRKLPPLPDEQQEDTKQISESVQRKDSETTLPEITEATADKPKKKKTRKEKKKKNKKSRKGYSNEPDLTMYNSPV